MVGSFGRAVTESFGKSEIPGPEHFCDLSRKLPRHGNSDHLMSFKESVFHFPFLWFVPGLCCIIWYSDFLIFWFLKRVQREGPKRGVRGPSMLTVGSFLLAPELFLITIVFGSFFTYTSSCLLTVGAFLLACELLCLQWESVSKKQLNGL